MLEFFREGGFGMWGVLVFGLAALAGAARYAWDLDPSRLRFSAVMTIAVAAASCHAMLIDAAQVFWFLEDPERVADAELTRVLLTGLKESTRPGGLGGIFVVLALVLMAVGIHRDGQKQRRAA